MYILQRDVYVHPVKPVKAFVCSIWATSRNSIFYNLIFG